MERIIAIIAAIIMLVSCGSRQKLTKEEIIDYGEIGFSDIVSNIGDKFEDGSTVLYDIYTIQPTFASLSNKSGNVCGGYTGIREPDMDEYQFFREVTDTVKGMTFTPLTVQTQVVAGINYKFYCRFSDGSEEYSPGHCYLTIYKPLPGQGEAKITSIEKLR